MSVYTPDEGERMRKWFYLVIGGALIVNAIVATTLGLSIGLDDPQLVGAVVGLVVGQGILFGTVGIVLFYKAIKRFIRERRVVGNDR